jgi:hypothetical protein
MSRLANSRFQLLRVARIIVAITGIYATLLQAAVPSTEYRVLEALYKGTGGPAWEHNEGWEPQPASNGPAHNACPRFGVTCETVQGQQHVTSIVLPRNGLVGRLPPNLNQLPYLRTFIVYGNQIGGPVPPLTGLNNLEEFFIESNAFTGPLPSLVGLTRLRYFDADANHFGGSLPSLDGLVNLESFDVSTNEIAGTIPDFPTLPNLKGYFIFLNRIHGAIPSLSELTTLEAFSAYENELIGEVPSLELLPNLQRFDVHSNHLSGTLPSIEGAQKLVVFSIASNAISGTLPRAPSNLQWARLCPNPLTIIDQPTIDPTWNVATGNTPWWATPSVSNECDEIFADTFG